MHLRFGGTFAIGSREGHSYYFGLVLPYPFESLRAGYRRDASLEQANPRAAGSSRAIPSTGALRRLMSNCGRRGRSRNSMLAPNLRPKVVSHGPRLLPRLIVRIGGRLVAGWPWSGSAPPGSSGPAHGPGGHHPGDPGPVAALPQREGLLALRFLSPARVLPEPLLPGP